MLRCCHITRAGRTLALWIAMFVAPAILASIFCSSAYAESDGVSAARSPSTPTGPSAGSVPVAPRGPIVESSKSAPVPTDRRMMDLAKRLASGEGAEPTSPAAPDAAGVTASRKSAGHSGDAEDHAEASNAMKLADPDDSRPLSSRVKHGEGALPGSTQQEGGSGSWILNGVTALGVVLILIFLLRAALRKAGVGGAIGPHPAVQVLSRVPVAPRNHVLLIRVGQRVLVVGDSVAGLRTLASIDEPEEVAEIITSAATAKPESITGGFRKMLSSFSGMYGAGEKEVGGDEEEFQVDRARDNVAGLVGRLRSGGGGEA